MKLITQNLSLAMLCIGLCFSSINLNAQCTLEFENDGDALLGDIMPNDNDIVNFDNPILSDQCFDVYDEDNCTCPATGSGTLDDVCISFELETIFDVYGGLVTAYDGGTTHQISHEGTGFRGDLKMGDSNAKKTSVGDVLCYNIRFDLAAHMHQYASDISVNTTSINTAGEAYESGAVIFLDATGVAYGTATYNGYFQDADGPGGTHPGVVASCPANPTASDPNFAFPAINAMPWSSTGTGVYIAQATNTVQPDLNGDGTDDNGTCTPVADANGTDNNVDVTGTAAGLNASDVVSGFIYRVCLEDVATTTADGVETTTLTNFTSTLNSLDFLACPPPPCGFPEPTITLAEDCGTFDFDIGTIDESSASGNGTNVTYATAAAGPWPGTAVDGDEGLPANGTTEYWINIADADDASCNDTFGPFTAPLGVIPACGTFPANPE